MFWQKTTEQLCMRETSWTIVYERDNFRESARAAFSWNRHSEWKFQQHAHIPSRKEKTQELSWCIKINIVQITPKFPLELTDQTRQDTCAWFKRRGGTEDSVLLFSIVEEGQWRIQLGMRMRQAPYHVCCDSLRCERHKWTHYKPKSPK